MDTLKRPTKWAMSSSDRRASSEKAFFKQTSKEKTISKGVKSTAKICQGDLFRVTALKGSAKSAMYTAPSVMHPIQSPREAKVLWKCNL